MERERSVSAAAQQERSGCGRPLSGLTVCLKAVTADEYSANSVNKDLNQKTNRALTILWLGLVSLEGAESRIESSNKCTFRAGRGCLWVVFYGFEACMWWIKQNHVNLAFLSSKDRMGVNLRHFNGLSKVLQSHCSVLLSQMWMRPLQSLDPNRRQAAAFFQNVNTASAFSLFILLTFMFPFVLY